MPIVSKLALAAELIDCLTVIVTRFEGFHKLKTRSDRMSTPSAKTGDV